MIDDAVVAGNACHHKFGMTMNEFEVKLTPDYRELAAKKLYLAFDIAIDGASPLQNNDDDFDLLEFIMSTRKDGKYFIWTCSCGVAECAGYVDGIEVHIEGDITNWIDHDLDKTYSFNTNNLRSSALMLEDEIKKWNNHAKSNDVELTIWPSWSMEYLLPALGIK